MNVFVTYAVGAGLSILIIAALILSLASVSNQWSDFLIEYEPQQVCVSLQNAVEIIHNPSDGSALLATMIVDLPKKMGGSEYAVEFKDNTIFIKSKKEYNCTVNDVILSGESRANRVQLEYSAPNRIMIR
ncbi:MAG: hypothetical protein V1870_00575 [Candidatus Aenigmatarchaeota archaeon]